MRRSFLSSSGRISHVWSLIEARRFSVTYGKEGGAPRPRPRRRVLGGRLRRSHRRTAAQSIVDDVSSWPHCGGLSDKCQHLPPYAI